MTNEEKAKEIAIDYADVELSPKTTIYEACIEMAEWKDEQFKTKKQAPIEKAEKFFKNEFYVSVSDQICSINNFTSMSNFIEQFKNYMQNESEN